MVLNQGNEPGKKPANNKVSNYPFELDRVKVFWIFILTILVLTFVFVFGYWTGQHNSTEFSTFAKEVNSPKDLSSENSEIKELLGDDSTKKTPQINEKEKAVNQDLKQNLKLGIAEEKKTQPEKEAVDEESETTKKNKKQSLSKTKKTQLKAEAKGRKYVIQFASFKEKDKANKLKEKIIESGMKAYVVKDGTVYKVRIGNFENYDKAAHSLSKAMKDFKVKDAYIFTTGSNKKA